jgi:hypothetical protein
VQVTPELGADKGGLPPIIDPPKLREDVEGLAGRTSLAEPEQASFDLFPTLKLGTENGSRPPNRAADVNPNEEAAEWNDLVPQPPNPVLAAGVAETEPLRPEEPRNGGKGFLGTASMM